MSYYKLMKKIEDRLGERTKAVKRTEFTGSGLLARSTMPVGSQKSLPSDAIDEIADYVEVIRKEKEEVIRGRK